MRLLRAADRQASPWKNGGGVTWEVAASPHGAPIEDFDWRVSIAEVATGGAFSKFPGVDRTLTVIEGQGLLLEVEGLDAETLDASSAPFAFAGDVTCEAKLTDGAIRDLNVMTRRGVWSARVRRTPGPGKLDLTAEVSFLVAVTPAQIDEIQLRPEDVLRFDEARPLSVGQGEFVLVELHRA
jgi:environmental stress-induced protein Ves